MKVQTLDKIKKICYIIKKNEKLTIRRKKMSRTDENIGFQIPKPIYCPYCGKFVCYEEEIRFCYLPYGLICPHCKKRINPHNIVY